MRKKWMLIIVVICAFVCIVCYTCKKQEIKGGNGQGMFEKNSSRISIYYNDNWLMDVTGENQKRLIKYLKTIDLEKYTEVKMDSTYCYKIDCNNDWGVVYINPETQNCYLKEKERRYMLPKDVYTYLFEELLK